MAKQSYGQVELRAARNKGLWLLACVFVFSVFVNLLMLTGPLFMLQVYDRVLASRSEETLFALFSLVGLLYALMGFLEYARGRVLARFGGRFQSALEPRVFATVMRRSLNPQFRSAPATGLQDLETIQLTFISPVMLALFDLPWTPLFVAAIFVFHPLLGWLAIAGGALLIALTLLNNGLTRRKMGNAQRASRQAYAFAEDARAASEIVHAQGMSASIFARWMGQRQNALSQSINASDWTGVFSSFSKAFRMFLQSAMLAVGAWLVLRGEMTAGAMIAGSILLGRALAPIEQTLGQWAQVQKAIAGWRELATLLQSTPPVPTKMDLPRPEAKLEVRNASVVAPGAKRPTLASVSFKLKPGEVLGVIGRSGSGKTTLAKMIMGVVAPSAGEIRLGGATLDQYGQDDLGSFVGYLPQQVTLFNGTIAENIARMSLEVDDAAVIAAAKRANAHDMILSLPDGYKTIVHGADSQLSGGQRQRIALARAFYGDPVLMVLDEPNSALDDEGSAALNAAVREYKSLGRTVIIMTHRPAAIRECDTLMMLDAGAIRAFGPRDEVLAKVLQQPQRGDRSRAGAPNGEAAQ